MAGWPAGALEGVVCRAVREGAQLLLCGTPLGYWDALSTNGFTRLRTAERRERPQANPERHGHLVVAKVRIEQTVHGVGCQTRHDGEREEANVGVTRARKYPKAGA